MSPSRRTLALLLAWFGLGIAASLSSDFGPLWLASGVAIAGIVLLDVLWTQWTRVPDLARTLPSVLPMGVWSPVALSLENTSRRSIALRLFDHHPPEMAIEGLPVELVLAPQTRTRIDYRLRPLARGRHRFEPAQIRMRSRLGLVERHAKTGPVQEVRAYPNFRASIGYELLALENRTGALGIRRRPRRGEGLDFHQLREYRAGDSLRQIDWKSTARLGKTISREYQDERDQQILFLLDCGRRLRAKDGDRSHFDAVLDAVLLTAHVAMRQGDAVGLMTFGGERRWLAPRKGSSHLNRLLNAVYDLEPSSQAADFNSAARDLVTRARKRALVILISNVRDEDTEELQMSLRLLSRRHLVLLASLREEGLAEALRAPVRRLEDATRVASVHLYLEQRKRALQQLGHAGAILLDGRAAELPVALVNRYLDVKAAGLL